MKFLIFNFFTCLTFLVQAQNHTLIFPKNGDVYSLETSSSKKPSINHRMIVKGSQTTVCVSGTTEVVLMVNDENNYVVRNVNKIYSTDSFILHPGINEIYSIAICSTCTNTTCYNYSDTVLIIYLQEVGLSTRVLQNGAVRLTWHRHIEYKIDTLWYHLYRNTSNSFSSAKKIGHWIKHKEQYIDVPPKDSTDYYYWIVCTHDTSGSLTSKPIGGYLAKVKAVDQNFSPNQPYQLQFWTNEKAINKTITYTGGTQSIKTELDVSHLPIGINTLFTRFCDAYGNWSVPYTSYFYRIPLSTNTELTKYEYWFNDQANRIEKLLSGKTINLSSLINVTNLDVGINRIHFRFKDKHGNWSVPYSEYFFKTTENNNRVLNKYRYWFDNRTDSVITKDISTTDSILNLIDCFVIPDTFSGQHQMTIQFKDAKNNWSIAYAVNFSICDPKITNCSDCKTFSNVNSVIYYRIDDVNGIKASDFDLINEKNVK